MSQKSFVVRDAVTNKILLGLFDPLTSYSDAEKALAVFEEKMKSFGWKVQGKIVEVTD